MAKERRVKRSVRRHFYPHCGCSWHLSAPQWGIYSCSARVRENQPYSMLVFGLDASEPSGLILNFVLVFRKDKMLTLAS